MIRKFLKTLIFCSILLQGPVFAEDDDMFASDEEMDGSTMEERFSEDDAVALDDSNAQEKENIEQDENPEMDEENSNSTQEAPLEESEDLAQDHYNDMEIDSEDENDMEIDSEDEDTSIEHSAATTDTIKNIVNETLGLGEPTASSTKIDSHQVILDAENEQDLKQSQKIVKKITKIHEENKQGRKEIKKEITILNKNLENLNKNFKKTPKKKKVTRKRYTVKKSHKTRYSPYANRTPNLAYGVSSSYVNAYAPFQNEQLYVSKSLNGQMPQLYVVKDYNHIKSYGYSYPKKRTQTQKYFNSKCKACGK